MSLVLLSVLLAGAVLVLALATLGGGGVPQRSPGLQADESLATDGVAAAEDQPSEGETPGAAPGSGISEGAQARPDEAPDVSGKSVVEAARALSRAGYEVAAIRTVQSEAEAGTAVGTEPSVRTAEPGTPVVLVMSGGPSGRETGT